MVKNKKIKMTSFGRGDFPSYLQIFENMGHLHARSFVFIKSKKHKI